MLNEKVGKSLKALRLMNNYSQEEVEIGVDISRSTLSKIENGTGKIDLDRLERFASFFKIDPITILSMATKDSAYELLQAQSSKVNDTPTEYRKVDVELARCQEKNTSLKKEITHLKQEISLQKSQIRDKDTIIKLQSR